MDTAMVLTLVILIYSIVLGLFMRFFAFLGNCDSEMRFMIENGKSRGIPAVNQKRKKLRKVKAPGLAVT